MIGKRLELKSECKVPERKTQYYHHSLDMVQTYTINYNCYRKLLDDTVVNIDKDILLSYIGTRLEALLGKWVLFDYIEFCLLIITSSTPNE